MFIEQPPMLVRCLWKGLWRAKRSKKRVVYLTFDDGPCPETTPLILDILRQYHAKTTFFCVGDNVRKFPELFEQILSEGHTVGNHTMHHLKGFETAKNAYCADVDEAAKWIKSALFRPPYGRISLPQLCELRKRYTVVFWDVMTRDYSPRLNPEMVLEIVKRYTRNGSIIVFHDSIKASRNTLVALPQVLDFLQKNGYEFELLNAKS